MSDYDIDGVIVELEFESGEKEQIAVPFSYDVLRDALDYPEDDCEITKWISEHPIVQEHIGEDDVLSSWDVPMTV